MVWHSHLLKNFPQFIVIHTVKAFGIVNKTEVGNNNPVYETAKETLMYRTVLWTLWERERVGRFGRMALKHVKYHV